MLRALRTASLGMLAQSLRVDNIANNLANTNTTGFKKSNIEFQDLFYQTFKPAGVVDQVNTQLPTELQIGHGNRPVATIKNFSQGDVVNTSNALDLALDGAGFFQIQRPDGTIAYTRDGNFSISSTGQIVNAAGLQLEPAISIPEDAVSINVGADGVVSVLVAGETDPQEVGQIELAKFINPAGLKNIGGNLFEQTTASGDPILGNPGSDGLGQVLQGYLEQSNVNVVQEMVDLIVAQRAFEVNSRAIRTAEQMLEIANNLKR
ncbi:MAG: flagellar basal-body rod protein FlgG [Calditrichaeota bacterium]|nr:MAG: flagellar basal-body rod protein FlgG [Calditrichota bacterium]